MARNRLRESEEATTGNGAGPFGDHDDAKPDVFRSTLSGIAHSIHGSGVEAAARNPVDGWLRHRELVSDGPDADDRRQRTKWLVAMRRPMLVVRSRRVRRPSGLRAAGQPDHLSSCDMSRI
jgi:hypothetical protein